MVGVFKVADDVATATNKAALDVTWIDTYTSILYNIVVGKLLTKYHIRKFKFENKYLVILN